MLRWLQSAKSKPKRPEPKPGLFLPSPNAKGISDETAARRLAANNAIEQQTRGQKRKRGSYVSYSDSTRAEVARYACQHGNSAAARHFSKKLSCNLNESVVRGWVTKYKKQLKAKPTIDPQEISELPTAKRGRPLLLGHELDTQVAEHVLAIRESGGIINRSILLSSAIGIVRHYDRSLLSEHGGPIELGRGWSDSMLTRLGFVKRKGTKAAKMIPNNFSDLKTTFHDVIRKTVETHKIPDDMIVNIDQTGINIIPVSDWTMDKQGAKQVPITGIDDKRQITGVMGVSSTGKLLPPQMIYAGKSDVCHPKFKFPAEWDITHSDSHWSTTETMITYIKNILVPYFDQIRDNKDLPIKQKALCILDVYRAHHVAEVLECFQENDICVAFVPACCTSELQPLDISGNAPFKKALKDKFTEWYAKQVSDGLNNKQTPAEIKVNLALSVVKPLHASWLLSAFDQTARLKDQLLLGWEKSGIQDAIKSAHVAEDSTNNEEILRE